MDLVLWRHAQAHDLVGEGDDLARALMPRGEKHALRMGTWLDCHLPESTRLLVSPARRTEQTVMALGRDYKIKKELAPDCTAAQLLALVQWPSAKGAVLVVGHQPVLGQVIAELLGLTVAECSVKKGAVWWLRTRMVDDKPKTVVLTVQAPEVL